MVGTIPDVTQIGFVFSPADLAHFVGSDCGLPQGSYTTAPSALLIKLGIADCSLLLDPNYVLDPTEIATIRNRLNTFNQIITNDANAAGMAVVDIYGLFIGILNNPPVFYGVPLTPRFNGGIEPRWRTPLQHRARALGKCVYSSSQSEVWVHYSPDQPGRTE